ncbi:hypothetical protein MASR2M8_09510 [Opitutaceae bacterium]
MKKVYILGPLIGVLVFAFFYWNFTKEFAVKEQEKIAAAKAEREAALKKEAADRKIAIDAALALQAQRKKEKADREAKEIADKEYRLKITDDRDRSFREQERLSKQAERLAKEIDIEKAAIAEIEKQKKFAVDEEVFLRQYVSQAEANSKSLEDVLKSIQDADNARAAAAAAAEAAKKK